MINTTMERIQLFIRPDQKQHLEKYSKKSKKNQSQIIRESIDAFLKTQEKTSLWKEHILQFAGRISDKQGEKMKNTAETIRHQPSNRISSIF